MSETLDGGQLTPTAAAESTYTVQVAQTFHVQNDEGSTGSTVAAWVDVAIITVPPRTKRRKIIGLGLVQAGLKPEVGGDPLRVRVLDAGSWHVTEVGAVQPEPELRIG